MSIRIFNVLGQNGAGKTFQSEEFAKRNDCGLVDTSSALDSFFANAEAQKMTEYRDINLAEQKHLRMNAGLVHDTIVAAAIIEKLKSAQTDRKNVVLVGCQRNPDQAQRFIDEILPAVNIPVENVKSVTINVSLETAIESTNIRNQEMAAAGKTARTDGDEESTIKRYNQSMKHQADIEKILKANGVEVRKFDRFNDKGTTAAAFSAYFRDMFQDSTIK